MNNRQPRRFSMLFPVVVFALLFLVLYLVSDVDSAISTTWNSFETKVEQGSVSSVVISQNTEVPTGVLSFYSGGDTYEVAVSDVNTAIDYLTEHEVIYQLEDVPNENTFFTIFWPILLVGVLVALMCIFLVNRMFAAANGSAGGGRSMQDFGKSHARMTDPNKQAVTFADVAGLEEEKEELSEVVDFLKNPSKYTNMGARIPKGIILVGSPGTGKTLLAKAVAGEAGVPFFSISGSDFVEMFVGVGASRVRDLFEDAKKHAPCIVFIDEIDAVARRRGTGMGGGHDEREQTLNQLLVEMDGFEVNEGIIVMAATNRVDILDPAILRPGRFDRKIGVGSPDVRGRKEILGVHVKNKPLSDDVDLDRIAQTTAGFTGADLENLMNEAAIRAAKENKPYISQSDIEASFVKVGIGEEKHSKVISEKEKRITAYHESGHAILYELLPDVGPVHSISIIPTGMGAAGYTMPLPDKDEMFMTKNQMLEEIEVALGGRIAEELIFGDITTGASQDIKQATEIARNMVTKYGMSDRIGMVDYGTDEDEVFIGRDLGRTRGYSENMAMEIDEEVHRIIEDCYQKAKKEITDHMDVLHASASLLIEKEKIGTEEFEALFAQESLSAPEPAPEEKNE